MDTPELLFSAKDRLLESAIKIFAIHGFEGASTRQLAKEANVNISAILYYFSGKDGLYLAAMKHLANIMKEGMANKAAIIATALKSNLSADNSQQLLHQFLREAISFMLSDKISPYAVQILVREQASPSSVFEIFYEVMKPVQDNLMHLISRITGLNLESEQLALCVYSLFGQIVIFRTHRELIFRQLEWQHFDDEIIEKITATILKQTDAIIELYKKPK